MDLTGAPVLVVGASGGIGGATADADRQAMFDRGAGRPPARRVGRPEDIAQAVLFVSTNPYAAGSTVTVDGGGTITG